MQRTTLFQAAVITRIGRIVS